MIVTAPVAERRAVWLDKNGRKNFTFEGADAVLVDYQDYH